MNERFEQIADFIHSRATKVRGFYEDLTTSLWFRPLFWMLGLGLLAIILITLDRTSAGDAARDFLPDILLGDTDSVRTMLGAIAGAMLTVTSLSFTMMMSTVVQTANAYTPRLLRQYIGDPNNQNVLGVLIGTFLYTLLVLYSIRGGDTMFVPLIASNVAVILAIASTIAFVYFLNYAATSIKVGNIISLIVSTTHQVIERQFEAELGEPWEDEQPYNTPDDDPHVIHAYETGYIQIYNLTELFEEAAERDLTIEIVSLVGDFVLKGVPLMRVWPAKKVDDDLLDLANGSYVVNRERTESQDIRFGFRQLSDIALRALSPGINDPSTAINAIHSLAAMLSYVISNRPISHVRCDESGTPRIILPAQTFRALVDEAFVQLRHYGKEDFLVVSNLIEMCGQVAHSAEQPKHKDVLWQFIVTTMQEVDEVIVSPAERERINDALHYAGHQFSRDTTPYALALESEIQLPPSLH